MAVYSNDAVQTVAANGAVLFNETVIPPGRVSIVHREGSGIITLRGLTYYQPFARFKVTFGANVSVPTGGTAGAILLAISLGGEPDATTTMTVTPAAVGEAFNVARETYIDVPAGCCTQVSVENISAAAIDVAQPTLAIERVG